MKFLVTVTTDLVGGLGEQTFVAEPGQKLKLRSDLVRKMSQLTISVKEAPDAQGDPQAPEAKAS